MFQYSYIRKCGTCTSIYGDPLSCLANDECKESCIEQIVRDYVNENIRRINTPYVSIGDDD